MLQKATYNPGKELNLQHNSNKDKRNTYTILTCLTLVTIKTHKSTSVHMCKVLRSRDVLYIVLSKSMHDKFGVDWCSGMSSLDLYDNPLFFLVGSPNVNDIKRN